MADLEGSQLTFELTKDDDGTPVLKLAGELDMTSAPRVDALVQPAIRASPERLVIDASGLQFADSSAIALWVRWANSVRHLELRDPSLFLRRVITRMGLAERLRMTP